MARPEMRVLIVTDDNAFAHEASARFRKAVPGLSATRLPLSGPFKSASQAPSLVIIDLDGPAEAVEGFILRCPSAFGAARVVGAGCLSDAPRVLQYVKLGVKDFLTLPFSEDEIAALAADAVQTED